MNVVIFAYRERLITIYVRYLVTTRAIQLHCDTLGHCLYNQVELACGVPSWLQLLVHGGKVVQRFIPISKQKLCNGSNILLLVKGVGGGGSDKGNTQELLGMYPSDSLSLHACMSRAWVLFLSLPSLPPSLTFFPSLPPSRPPSLSLSLYIPHPFSHTLSEQLCKGLVLICGY